MKKLLLLLTCLTVLTFSAIAQDESSCPAIVETALAAVDNLCADTGRNQACYGNLLLEAQPARGVTNLHFDSPGDITDVAKIGGLRLSAMNTDKREWGVSLMRLQANLPDTLPGQNVTVLMFGDVELTSATTSDRDTALKPLQAFYFRSGIDDAPCTEAPDSGILIHTPAGATKVELVINEVNIWLGSTAYLQAQPNGEMVISVVEGAAVVKAFDTARAVPAGGKVRIPLTQTLAPTAPPGEIEPYDFADLQALPISLLSRELRLQQPLIVETHPVESRGRKLTLEVLECSSWEPIMAEQLVTFQHGIGFSKSRADAERERQGHSAAIAVDNLSLFVYFEGLTFHEGSNLYGDRARADWIATPGAHTVTSVWTHPNEPMDTCNFTVK